MTRADEARLSDLDRHAGLFIVRVFVDETDLPDDTYKKILSAKDVFILSDELSAKRAQEIIKLTAVVEQQLKKLLICVLPETEKVLSDIIETHQKHRSDFKPTSRIEWCKKINDFSFGELPQVLQEDISELAKRQLLSREGLLSLISTAKDFDALKAGIAEVSKPKTVWSSLCTLLEKPVNYRYLATALVDLCNARNEAAHLNTITAKRLIEVKKGQSHVMSHIINTKSGYRDDLQANMKNLSEVMRPILESAAKIDPTIFASYQKMIEETFKPVTDTLSSLQIDIKSPVFIDSIKQNASYQSKIVESFHAAYKNMYAMDDYKDLIEKLSRTNFLTYSKNALEEIGKLKPEIERQLGKQGKMQRSNKNELGMNESRSDDDKESKQA